MSAKLKYFLFNTFLAVLVCGCGSSEPEKKLETAVSPRLESPIELEGPIKISLAKLLKASRSELAHKADICLGQIKYELNRDLKNQVSGNVQFPLILPIYREAEYSPKMGFSLPTYTEPGQKDSRLARHLARHGDLEAARKLVEAGDEATMRIINSYRWDRNYPVEWTRYVAMLIHRSTLQLAYGDEKAAKQIVGIHRQLLEIFDEKARNSALGSALLNRGWGILTLARNYWTKGNAKHLAKQADKVLENWGAISSPDISFISAANKNQESIFVAKNPQRALDLLCVPFPHKHANEIVLFTDDRGQPANIAIFYEPGVTDEFLQPGYLRPFLQPKGATIYRFGDWEGNVFEIPHNLSVGGIVRLSHRTKSPTLPRHFGLLHLDRSFGQNRILAARGEQGPILRVKETGVLRRIEKAIPGLSVAKAEIHRNKEFDVVDRLVFFPDTEEKSIPSIVKIAHSLWKKFGPSQKITSSGSSLGGEVRLIWQDNRTQFDLIVPHTREQFPKVVVTDRSMKSPRERQQMVQARDQMERQVRLDTGQPLTFLKRSLEGISLGNSQEKVVKRFPKSKSTFPNLIGNNLWVVITGTKGNPSWVPREIVARFDNDSKVVNEIRVKYTAKRKKGLKDLLNYLKHHSGQPSQELDGKIRRYVWQDDLTELTALDSRMGVELRIRKRPMAGSNAANSPLVLFPTGPKNCSLGMRKEQLLNAWKVRNPRTTGGALQLTPAVDSEFSAILVWFQNGRVGRIVGSHRPSENFPNDTTAGRAVLKAWSSRMLSFGWPFYQEFTPKRRLHSCANQDDQTRIRIYWRADGAGKRNIFTEWVKVKN